MFNNLLSFWKGKDFLTEVFGEFKEMLEAAQGMYEAACEQLLGENTHPGLKDNIYAADKKINSLQKSIRRRIVEHLTLQPTIDINVCLLLMSVVKDAERLGDYVKNLYGVSELLEKPIDMEGFSSFFDGMNESILCFFERTKEAFIESENKEAILSFGQEREIAKRCDEIVKELAAGSLTVNEAVCYTLIVRYFKRLSAHLGNIATSVVLPLSDLDYFDEPKLNQADE